MKNLFVVMLLGLSCLAPMAVLADGPDDDYVSIYALIQQADSLSEKGQTGAALGKYSEAQGALNRFRKNYPDAYPKVVKFRMNYLEGRIEQIKAKSAVATNAVPSAPSNSAPSTRTNSATSAPAVSAELENQVKGLQEQVRQLQDERSSIEAKLKEALAARPAEADPQELAKARTQITSLQKENELLKVTIDSQKTNQAVAAAPELEKARRALAEANQKIDALSQVNVSLESERKTLQEQMKKMGVNDSATAALREENELLKKQVAELKKAAPATPTAALDSKLKEAQAQIAALQSDQEIMRLQKIALEMRVKQLTTSNAVAVPAFGTNVTKVASTNAPSTTTEPLDSVTANRIAQLEAQRDELQKSLEAATRDAQGRRKGKVAAERMEEMSRQLASLRARIVIFEAAKIPYTAEESALFSTPDATLTASAHSNGRKRPKELSAAGQALLTDAKRYFVAGEFDKAEAKYQEALKLDPKNPGLLSDLGSIQLQEGKLAESEKNIQGAIAQDPDDSFNLLVLGQLKFRQKKYDDAFDALSRAAELSPQNPRVQNALGLTLSEKGLRGPAETAFRKAIQIDPGFSDAHMNLAVVYATQKPPLMELARWHYQKALAAGQKPSAQLEKMLNPTGTATQ